MIHTHFLCSPFSLQVSVRPNELIDLEWIQTNEVRQREAAGSWHVIFNKHMSFSPITLLLQMEHLTPLHTPPHRSVTHTISNGFFSEFRPMPTRTPTNTHGHTHTHKCKQEIISFQTGEIFFLVFFFREIIVMVAPDSG